MARVESYVNCISDRLSGVELGTRKFGLLVNQLPSELSRMTELLSIVEESVFCCPNRSRIDDLLKSSIRSVVPQSARDWRAYVVVYGVTANDLGRIVHQELDNARIIPCCCDIGSYRSRDSVRVTARDRPLPTKVPSR